MVVRDNFKVLTEDQMTLLHISGFSKGPGEKGNWSLVVGLANIVNGSDQNKKAPIGVYDLMVELEVSLIAIMTHHFF